MNINMPDIKEPMGIYYITNKLNNRIYVGSSNGLKKRRSSHKTALVNNRHGNSYLQNSFNKYGIDSFKYQVIEYVNDENILRVREQYHMDKLQSYMRDKGYNIARQATGGGYYGEDNGWFGKGYLQEGLLNHFYGETHTKEVRKMLSDNAKLKKGELNPNYGNRYGKNTRSTSVIQIDVETKKKIKEWDSQTRVYHDWGYEVVGGGMTRTCKEFKKGILVQHMGYYWCYSEDYKNIDKAKVKERNKEIAVVKLDKKTNKAIATYESAQEASREEDICRHGISRVARGVNNLAGGYKWMYLEEYEESKATQ